MRIPEPKFLLKDPSDDKPQLIILTVRFAEQRLRFSTGEYCLPRLWSKEKQRCIKSKENSRWQETNFKLDEMDLFVKNELNAMGAAGGISLDKLKQEMDAYTGIAKPKSTAYLVDYVERIIAEMRSGARMQPGGERYSLWTIKGYITLSNHLLEYEKDRRKRVTLDSINLSFYYDFIEYFNSRKYALNTVGKHVKNIKSAMSLAVEDGVTSNSDWRNRKFRVPMEAPDTVYLSMGELETIAAADMPDKATEAVRDIFIMACFLGVRYSDLSMITPSDFFSQNGANLIRIRQNKTGEVVVIPLKEVVRNIMLKYEGRVPRVLSNQKMNAYLKTIGKVANLTDMVKYHRTEGGRVVEYSDPKWKLITTHTARRSFATNMYLAGVPSISIMKITGHKTEKSFLRYIRISQEDNAMKMLSHPFFADAIKK